MDVSRSDRGGGADAAAQAVGFPHPSRPGYYGTVFSEEIRSALALFASALIPGEGTYPSAADAQVVRFVEERSSADDRARIEGLFADGVCESADAAKEAARTLESDRPTEFAWIRDFVYHAYYASRRVLAAMTDYGSEYHGAPQPLGYVITDPMLMPATPRGGYIATDEVSSVNH